MRRGFAGHIYALRFGTAQKSSVQNRLTAQTQELRFVVGQRVMHDIMGGGMVVDIDRGRMAYVIRFDSLPTPRRINFRANSLKEG